MYFFLVGKRERKYLSPTSVTNNDDFNVNFYFQLFRKEGKNCSENIWNDINPQHRRLFNLFPTLKGKLSKKMVL